MLLQGGIGTHHPRRMRGWPMQHVCRSIHEEVHRKQLISKAIHRDAWRRRAAAEERKRKRAEENAMSSEDKKEWWQPAKLGMEFASIFHLERGIEDKSELNRILKESQERGQLVVAEFFGPWCKACKAMQPKIMQVVKEHPDVVFVKVNVEKNLSLSKDLGVKKLPWIQFYTGKDDPVFQFHLAKVQDKAKYLTRKIEMYK